MSTDNKTSVLIDSLLPDFLETEGPKFQAFVKAYYEWMETSGQMTAVSKELPKTADLDEAAEEYLKYFKREILSQFPEDILADKRLVYKRIKDLYRAKGTEQSYKLLFRILFDEEIDIYYPGQDILRASDGRWVQDTSIRLTQPFTGTLSPERLAGTITGQSSGATARVERVQLLIDDGVEVFEVFIDDTTGTFLDAEVVENTEGTFTGTVTSKVGGLQRVIILEGGSGHQKNDIVDIYSNSGSGGRGVIEVTDDGKIVSLRVSNSGVNFARTDPVTIHNLTRSGFVDNGLNIEIVDGGFGYQVNTFVTFTGGDGSGASVRVSEITNANTITIGSNTYTFGTIANLEIVAQGDGYATLPTATIKDEIIYNLGLSLVDFNIVDGGKGYTTNATITISGGGGAGASFTIDSISDTEVVSVYTDKIGALASTTLNANTFGASNTASISAGLAAANISSTLISALEFANVTVGTISSITRTNSGNNYTSAPSVSVVEEDVSAANILDETTGTYYGRNAEITANLSPYFLGNNAVLSVSRANANAVGAPLITAPIEYTGRYNDVKGFLSWSNKLQDNFFYQEFSYVIKSEKTLDLYRDIVNSAVHPSGMKLFGEFRFDIVIDTALPTIARETVLYQNHNTEDTLFIPSVVSADIDQYIKSEDKAAISDYPEVEIELVEPAYADLEVDITGAGFQVEIELFANQRSYIFDGDDLIEAMIQFLIQDVTINSRTANLALTAIGDIWDPRYPANSAFGYSDTGGVWLANNGLYFSPADLYHANTVLDQQIAVGLHTFNEGMDLIPSFGLDSCNVSITPFYMLPIYALEDQLQGVRLWDVIGEHENDIIGWVTNSDRIGEWDYSNTVLTFPQKSINEYDDVRPKGKIGFWANNAISDFVGDYDDQWLANHIPTDWAVEYAPPIVTIPAATAFGDITALDQSFDAFSEFTGPTGTDPANGGQTFSEFQIEDIANSIIHPNWSDFALNSEITIPTQTEVSYYENGQEHLWLHVAQNIGRVANDDFTIWSTLVIPTHQIDRSVDSINIVGDEVGFYNSRSVLDTFISEIASNTITTFADIDLNSVYSPVFGDIHDESSQFVPVDAILDMQIPVTGSLADNTISAGQQVETWANTALNDNEWFWFPSTAVSSNNRVISNIGIVNEVNLVTISSTLTFGVDMNIERYEDGVGFFNSIQPYTEQISVHQNVVVGDLVANNVSLDSMYNPVFDSITSGSSKYVPEPQINVTIDIKQESGIADTLISSLAGFRIIDWDNNYGDIWAFNNDGVSANLISDFSSETIQYHINNYGDYWALESANMESIIWPSTTVSIDAEMWLGNTLYQSSSPTISRQYLNDQISLYANTQISELAEFTLGYYETTTFDSANTSIATFDITTMRFDQERG